MFAKRQTAQQWEHQQISVNGVSLHVVQAGPVEGPLVILLHGFPEYWASWQRYIEPLTENGYRVWAPDQRGYNLSSKPTEIGAYALDHLAGDITGLMDHAGRDKARIIGHDWGGTVAWWLAMQAPARVERILGQLPARYREVLTYRFLLDCSIRETAEHMRLTEYNVKVLQYQALKKAAALDPNLV